VTQVAEQTLTRNESADRIKEIWSTIVEEAPRSTYDMRAVGAGVYTMARFDLVGVHDDHYNWLMERLEKGSVLDDIDAFAAKMRDAGGALDAPWRD